MKTQDARSTAEATTQLHIGVPSMPRHAGVGEITS